MRVLQFITPSGFYGAERWVLALANNLPSADMVCDLAVTEEGPAQDLSVARLYPHSAGLVHYVSMKGRFDFGAVTKLVEIIKSRNIDIIHTHGYKSDILGLLAARKAGIKIVSTPHGFSNNVGWKLRLFIRLGLFALKFFDKVAPLSEQLVFDLKRYGIKDKQLHFIENGVDLTELAPYRKTIPAKDFSAGSGLHLGYIGQLIPRKGLADLLQAFNLLWQRFPDSKLTLIGEGSQRSELEALAKTLPAASAISFLGFRGDRIVLLKDFDAFALTSSLEGIPRCLMEAMAVGVPVVAYDIPGVDQLITHESTGLLAPLGDWQQLANHLIRLAAEPELANKISLAARQLVDQRFSAARMAAEYQQLFLELLQSPKAAATLEHD
ncbi:group 1 glycosyl transferase [Alishewanella agri BL06]|uniref:Group 1 glycosyl transferase n=1 Tax=Alishewanella agri BL06 TaxID=1195246 RepID=I8UED9_9ALTE|nr:glycosyltransferase [Alishewanella agri]EIW90353.1 group 1 glycosyl transferase [Alishewanella agri BL06]